MTGHAPQRPPRAPPSREPRDFRERGSILRRSKWHNANMTTMAHPTGANRATVDDGGSTTTLSTALAAAFSSDASLFRLVPAAIAFPYDEDEVRRILTIARRLGVSITSRGAGTSIAGNAIGRGIVIDFSRHMNAVVDLDPAEQSAWVEA